MSERLTKTMVLILLSDQDWFYSWQHTIQTRYGKLEVRRQSLEALVERGYLTKRTTVNGLGAPLVRYYRIPTVLPRQAFQYFGLSIQSRSSLVAELA